MAARIEVPAGAGAIQEFVRFHDRVYADRGAFWPAFPALEALPVGGTGPVAEDRRCRPSSPGEDGTIVARARRGGRTLPASLGRAARSRRQVSRRCRARAVRAMMDAACEWLADRRGRGALRHGSARHAVRHRRLRVAAAEHPALQSALLSRVPEGRRLRGRARLRGLPDHRAPGARGALGRRRDRRRARGVPSRAAARRPREAARGADGGHLQRDLLRALGHVAGHRGGAGDVSRSLRVGRRARHVRDRLPTTSRWVR
jgi:hypothetical protein